MILCNKKQLLVLAGAGASIQFEMPGLVQIDTLLANIARPFFTVPTGCGVDLYSALRRILQNHSNQAINFEDVIYHMNVLDSMMRGDNPLHGLLDCSSLPMVQDHSGNVRPIDSEVLGLLSTALLDGLVDQFRHLSRRVVVNADILAVRDLFHTLGHEYHINLVNLNYDNVLQVACPEFFTGFDARTGKFLAKDVLKDHRRDLHFQIHGSVHFDLKGNEDSLHAIYWNPDLTSSFAPNSAGRNQNAMREGQAVSQSAFILGYGKPHQLLRQPFRTFYSALDQLVAESDACLVIGYGFHDEHINGAFANYFERNPARPVIVITCSPAQMPSMRSADGDWPLALLRAFPATSEAFRSATGVPFRLVGELRPNLFEYNTSRPLAVWHHGFLEACGEPRTVSNFFEFLRNASA